MLQPQSIRFHLAAVFLLFFALVVVLGSFSIWRLANFNLLSADVAEIWLPTTRALGDLNNYTSDFRAVEGGNLLSSDPSEAAATEKEMADLDRTIADVRARIRSHPARCRRERSLRPVQGALERLSRHRQPDAGLCRAATARTRRGRSTEAHHARAYNAASDTLGQLTDQAVASAQAASARLAAAYHQAFWLILLAIVIAGVLVVAALLHISRYHFRAAAPSRRPHASPCRQRYRHRNSRNRIAATKSAKWRRRPWSSATMHSN